MELTHLPISISRHQLSIRPASTTTMITNPSQELQLIQSGWSKFHECDVCGGGGKRMYRKKSLKKGYEVTVWMSNQGKADSFSITKYSKKIVTGTIDKLMEEVNKLV